MPVPCRYRIAVVPLPPLFQSTSSITARSKASRRSAGRAHAIKLLAPFRGSRRPIIGRRRSLPVTGLLARLPSGLRRLSGGCNADVLDWSSGNFDADRLRLEAYGRYCRERPRRCSQPQHSHESIRIVVRFCRQWPRHFDRARNSTSKIRPTQLSRGSCSRLLLARSGFCAWRSARSRQHRKPS